MVKFVPSAAGQRIEKNENVMLKTPKNLNKKAVQSPTSKLVAVIKNGMTEQEMKESGEQWATHKGPYMTLQEVLAVEAAKQRK
ncbi:hypothetical protein [Spirosoma flavum]|uniref:Uncharacterized protein n=1 Tax=Spirosoma flavum TaxID=2048557 RepID=A0ABW6ASS8_9BACT